MIYHVHHLRLIFVFSLVLGKKMGFGMVDLMVLNALTKPSKVQQKIEAKITAF